MKWKTYAVGLLLGGCIAAAATAGALATDPIKEGGFGDYVTCHSGSQLDGWFIYPLSV